MSISPHPVEPLLEIVYSNCEVLPLLEHDQEHPVEGLCVVNPLAAKVSLSDLGQKTPYQKKLIFFSNEILRYLQPPSQLERRVVENAELEEEVFYFFLKGQLLPPPPPDALASLPRLCDQPRLRVAAHLGVLGGL